MNHTTENSADAPARPKVVDVPVVALNRLSGDGYELVVERGGIAFISGQLINIHGRNRLEDRSYTVCSGEQDEHLSILFKVVTNGILTPQLEALSVGDTLCISGPYGEFTIRDHQRPIIFFATGTGVAPCRSYARTHPGLNMTLIHGVPRADDLYYRDAFQSFTYHPCVSRERIGGTFHGRVTDFARAHNFPDQSHYYLCGANEMIYEIQEILGDRGVEQSCIFTEAYYYRSDD